MYTKLESLRGLAACLVVLFHSTYNYGDRMLSFLSHSYLFVDFFFILSGCVMSHAYSEKIQQGMKFFKYIILRTGRLYPLHLFMLLAWLPYILIKQYLYSSGFGGSEQFDTNNVASFISNLFLLHSMGFHEYLSWNLPSWSISTEFFAYIVFFILTGLLDKKSSLVLPLIVSALCYSILFSTGARDLNITYDFGIFRCVGAFYMGVLIFRLRPMVISLLTEKSTFVLEFVALSAVIIMVSYASKGSIIMITTLSSFAFALLVFSSESSGPIGRLLNLAPMRAIGVWSYSIYMVHALVVDAFSNVIDFIIKPNPVYLSGFYSLIINGFMLLLIIAISRFTYIYVEKYWRDRIKKQFS